MAEESAWPVVVLCGGLVAILCVGVPTAVIGAFVVGFAYPHDVHLGTCYVTASTIETIPSAPGDLYRGYWTVSRYGRADPPVFAGSNVAIPVYANGGSVYANRTALETVLKSRRVDANHPCYLYESYTAPAGPKEHWIWQARAIVFESPYMTDAVIVGLCFFGVAICTILIEALLMLLWLADFLLAGLLRCGSRLFERPEKPQ